MTDTITIPAVKKFSNPTLGGDVFYGDFTTNIKGKLVNVAVSNHIKDIDKKYNFRVVTKVRAGFASIHDCPNEYPKNVIAGYKKNALINIQVEVEYDSGNKSWLNVYTTKNGKWHSIDLGFLKVLTVGDMRQSFPDMCDMALWNLVDAKTWADHVFVKK